MSATRKETAKPLGPNAQRVQKVCPAVLDLLGEALVSALDHDSPDSTNDGYWRQVHLIFVLRILIARTSSELGAAVLEKHKEDQRQELPYSKVTAAQLAERLHLFRDLLKSACQLDENHLMPRVAEAYQLSELETRVVQFLVTCKTQANTCIPSLLPSTGNRYCGEEEVWYSSAMIQYACGASPLELTKLLDEDHSLIKDRVLLLNQDDLGGSPSLEISEEACRALLGLDLDVSDKLKLAGTKLLTMLDGHEDDDVDFHNVLPSPMRPQDPAAQAMIADMLRDVVLDGDQTPVSMNIMESIVGQQMMAEQSSDSGELVTEDDLKEEDDAKTSSTEAVVDDPKQPRAYTCELDYLKDQFELVMQKMLQSRQRIAQDLRNASISDSKPRYPWMRNTEPTKTSVGETAAKIRLARRKIDLSLELTRKEGNFYPRLELLVAQLGLDEFEKSVLVYLAGSMISPIFKSCLQSEAASAFGRGSSVCVGDLLGVFFDSFEEQVAGRTYFYRSSKLIRKGLIKPSSGYGLGPADLTDQGLMLDRRVLDCIVGLDKESTEVSQGSNLYDPKVSLDSVVLPSELKTGIINAVTHFDAFRRYRKHHPGFDDAISYGVGLTLMFCGPSGTGKTMTANAIAAKLGKKLLLVNFPRLSDSRSDRSETSPYQSILREAELSDAIIFFDECESLFSSRSMGGSSETTELLTELERFEGIVFLATNRPYDLDEAMYRRISEVFDFQPPNYLERLEIWRLVTAHESIPCEESIDWESIALQYELTGGFVKNAVIASLLDAVGRDAASPKITQDDIVEGCKKQVRGALQMVEFDERVLPRAGLDELVASDGIKEQLREMVSLEKARGILFGSWGFDDDMRSRQGTTALFWGPSGTGRSRAAEALGFELGKPLKVVDMPRLLDEKRSRKRDMTGTAAVREIFSEARLMNAVLVLDGFSLNPDRGGSGGADDTRVLNMVVREMTRFPGVVIMMVDTTGSLDVFVSRLDKGLLSGLKFVVEFKRPSESNRRLLWEQLMPESVPIAGTIDFDSLAKASDDFTLVQIGNAIYRAAADCALRPDEKKRRVSMADLNKAIEEEKSRGESAVDRWVKAQYL